MFEIKKIHARQIMDSRGNPTIECDITLSDGAFGRAAFHLAHQPVLSKPLNCVTVATTIWAKVY